MDSIITSLIKSFIEDLRVHESCLLGDEGRGFYNLLGTLNPERVLIAAGAVGTARLAHVESRYICR